MPAKHDRASSLIIWIIVKTKVVTDRQAEGERDRIKQLIGVPTVLIGVLSNDSFKQSKPHDDTSSDNNRMTTDNYYVAVAEVLRNTTLGLYTEYIAIKVIIKYSHSSICLCLSMYPMTVVTNAMIVTCHDIIQAFSFTFDNLIP